MHDSEGEDEYSTHAIMRYYAYILLPSFCWIIHSYVKMKNNEWQWEAWSALIGISQCKVQWLWLLKWRLVLQEAQSWCCLVILFLFVLVDEQCSNWTFLTEIAKEENAWQWIHIKDRKTSKSTSHLKYYGLGLAVRHNFLQNVT